MNIPQTKVGEWWSISDNRLPRNEEIDRALDQHYQDMVANLRARKEFEEVIKVAKIGNTYKLADGRCRLLAARYLVQEESIDVLSFIPVRVFVCKTEEDVIALRMTSNYVRSKNLAGDYLALKSILLKLGDYKAVARQFGIPTRDLRYMDTNLSQVPEILLKGVIDTKIALGTAIKVGKLENPETKKAMVTKFLQEGKLTGDDVDATRHAIREEAKGSLGFMNEVEMPRSRTSWTRQEIVTAANLAKAEGASRTAAYLLGLVT